MNPFEKEPQTMNELIKESFIYYPDVLKKIWPAIIVFVIFKNILFYVLDKLNHLVIGVVLDVLFSVATLFFLNLILYQGYQIILGYIHSWPQDLKRSLWKLPKIFLAFIMILLIFISTWILARWFVSILGSDAQMQTLLILIFFFLGFILLAEAGYLFYVIPLILIDDEKILTAFKLSAEYVREDKRLIFVPYMLVLVFIFLLLPDLHHAAWLRQHYLSIPFDLISFSLLLPFLVNIIIFSMREIQKIRSE